MFILAISNTLLFFISGFGILQAILSSLLIFFHPKSDRAVSSFLALYIVAWTAPMIMPLIIQFSAWQNGIVLEAFPLVLGPLLYLYIRSFNERIGWKKVWQHFVMFGVFLLIDVTLYFILRDKYPLSNKLPEELIVHPGVRSMIGLRIVQMIIYYFLARRTLRSYQRSIKHLFSETSRINLQWGIWFVNGYLVLVLAIIAVFFLVGAFPQQFGLILLLNVALATPYIYLITYKGLTQPTAWQLQPQVPEKVVAEELAEAKQLDVTSTESKVNRASKNQIPDGKMFELVNRVTHLMQKEKIYQETELTLHQVAERLQIPTYQVSMIINDGMKRNFYDLVNEYRVNEAKRLLADPAHHNYTILSIAFEAGFNSKTTFNTVFKKITGVTPTQFREQTKNELSPA